MADLTRRLAAILSADVAGYTRLMAEDEAGTISALQVRRSEIFRLVEEHGGRVVDSPGDKSTRFRAPSVAIASRGW